LLSFLSSTFRPLPLKGATTHWLDSLSFYDFLFAFS
jgi:hypothetical protein